MDLLNTKTNLMKQTDINKYLEETKHQPNYFIDTYDIKKAKTFFNKQIKNVNKKFKPWIDPDCGYQVRNTLNVRPFQNFVENSYHSCCFFTTARPICLDEIGLYVPELLGDKIEEWERKNYDDLKIRKWTDRGQDQKDVWESDLVEENDDDDGNEDEDMEDNSDVEQAEPDQQPENLLTPQKLEKMTKIDEFASQKTIMAPDVLIGLGHCTYLLAHSLVLCNSKYFAERLKIQHKFNRNCHYMKNSKLVAIDCPDLADPNRFPRELSEKYAELFKKKKDISPFADSDEDQDQDQKEGGGEEYEEEKGKNDDQNRPSGPEKKQLLDLVLKTITALYLTTFRLDHELDKNIFHFTAKNYESPIINKIAYEKNRFKNGRRVKKGDIKLLEDTYEKHLTLKRKVNFNIFKERFKENSTEDPIYRFLKIREDRKIGVYHDLTKNEQEIMESNLSEKTLFERKKRNCEKRPVEESMGDLFDKVNRFLNDE